MAYAFRANCKVAIGGWSVDSAADPRAELLALEVSAAMGTAFDACHLSVYAPAPKKKGLLEEAIGEAASMAAATLGLGGAAKPPAFSIQVRGHDIKHGDRLTVELASGDRSGKVATVDVYRMESTLGETRIAGGTGKSKLALARLNQVYQNQSLQQIVQDLADQAQVSTGTIDSGSTYNYVVVHESKNLLTHINELARREGMDLFFDADNRLNVTAFKKTKADHTFTYGVDILELVAQNDEPAAEHVSVYGESPASHQGPSSWHWLAKDLSPFRANVGSGVRLLPISDRAIRTKDGADAHARAKLGAVKDQASTGRLTVLGNPQVAVGQAIEIASAPKPEQNGLFKVAAAVHRYSKREGYVTSIVFTGQGGARLAEGLLGRALDALAGAARL